ncbi:hypothetical protein ACEPAG_3932 [Sanghuangporus baumii]
MTNELEAPRDLVSSSVSEILGICERTKKEFPSLNEPVHPSEFSPEGIRNHPAVSERITVAIAAVTQLVATLQNPLVNPWNSSAEAANAAEIIRNTGPNGMHVYDIAAKSGFDSKKLERVLSFLATNHYFREVKEKTFAHNLLSSLLDTGKDLKDCFSPSKHANASGFASVAGLGSLSADRSSLSVLASDFFNNQPSLPDPPDIFLLRWILHDWPDKYAIHILKKLRKAGIPGKTKLLIIENLMSYACEPEEIPVKEVGTVTASSKPPLAPLLSNLGGANLLPYAIDIVASTSLNAGERTVQDFIDIFLSFLKHLVGYSLIFGGSMEVRCFGRALWQNRVPISMRLGTGIIFLNFTVI